MVLHQSLPFGRTRGPSPGYVRGEKHTAVWHRIAQWFGIEAAPLPDRIIPLETQLADAVPVWAEIARKYSLVMADLNVLTSPWHTDADLGRPIEVLTDMSKSRKLGFLDYQATDDSFFDLFTTLRAEHLIP